MAVGREGQGPTDLEPAQDPAGVAFQRIVSPWDADVTSTPRRVKVTSASCCPGRTG